MNKKNILIILLTLFFGLGLTQAQEESKSDTLKFNDVKAQAKEFIADYRSIKLSPAQEKIKVEALSDISAPCCSTFPMATCCCPCNLAKSVWGLSSFLIAKKNYNVKQVKEAVIAWIQFTNPSGFNGKACFQNRCEAAFHKDGCGGMKEENFVY